ncbi:35391_t:CDS:2, partial [Gigaspora margarita]
EFPDATSYLNCALFNEKECWAICYTSKVFNAKIQSTQRVEDQNTIVKNLVNSSAFLINLVKSIDEQIDQKIAQAIWYTLCLIDDFEDLGLQSNSTELPNLTQSFNLSDSTEQSLTEQFNSTDI